MKKLKSIPSHFVKTPSLFEKIPPPIIWDILVRLPTKACLNSKRVCKSWYQIIISSEFCALRFSRSPFFTLFLYGKFFSSRINFLLLDVDKSLKFDNRGNLSFNPETMIRFKSKFTIPHYDLYVVNECNGLICMKSYGNWSPLIVCNLLTGQEVVVEQDCDPSSYVEIYGFGCCPVTHKFKVLRILRSGSSKFYAEVCTLGSDEWRDVGRAPPCYRSFNDNGSVFLHGSLHIFSIHEYCIWSFRFGNEQFVRVPTTDVLKNRLKGAYGNVNVFEACLSISFVPKEGSQYEVWVMKEYGMKDSWVKRFVFDSGYCGIPLPLFQIDDTTMLVCIEGGHSLATSVIGSRKCKPAEVLGAWSYRVIAANVKFSKLQICN